MKRFLLGFSITLAVGILFCVVVSLVKPDADFEKIGQGVAVLALAIGAAASVEKKQKKKSEQRVEVHEETPE